MYKYSENNFIYFHSLIKYLKSFTNLIVLLSIFEIYFDDLY